MAGQRACAAGGGAEILAAARAAAAGCGERRLPAVAGADRGGGRVFYKTARDGSAGAAAGAYGGAPWEIQDEEIFAGAAGVEGVYRAEEAAGGRCGEDRGG